MERTRIIALKVNEEEKEIFESMSNIRGLTRSSYLRTCALKDAENYKMEVGLKLNEQNINGNNKNEPKKRYSI